MFIFISTILAVYDIEKVSVNGVVQEPKHEFTSGVLVYVLSRFHAALTCPASRHLSPWDRLNLRSIISISHFIRTSTRSRDQTHMLQYSRVADYCLCHRRPKPFKTTVRPRSEKALALINSVEI